MYFKTYGKPYDYQNLACISNYYFQESIVGKVMRTLTLLQCGLGCIPSYVGWVFWVSLYSAQRGFSPGIPVFPSHQKSTLDLIRCDSVWFVSSLIMYKKKNQAFWLVNDQRNSQMTNQIFHFQIKRTPRMAQLMA